MGGAAAGKGSVALVVARSRDLFPLAKGPCANRGIVEPERVAGTPPLFQIYEVIFSVAHGVGWAIARFEMRLRVTSRRDCTAWRRDAFFGTRSIVAANRALVVLLLFFIWRLNFGVCPRSF